MFPILILYHYFTQHILINDDVLWLFVQPFRFQWCPIGRLAQLPSVFEYVLPSKLLIYCYFRFFTVNE